MLSNVPGRKSVPLEMHESPMINQEQQQTTFGWVAEDEINGSGVNLWQQSHNQSPEGQSPISDHE